jgi:phosphomevalonate kinase
MIGLTSSAFGKLMIAGEYAVLFGHKALVTTIDTRAIAWFHPKNERAFFSYTGKEHRRLDEHPLFLAFVDACRDFNVTPNNGHYLLNTSAFFDDAGRKFGFGSSAAAIAALSKIVVLQGLLDKTKLFDLAYLAHRKFSHGLGSGADVAACLFGGTILYQRSVLPVSCPNISFFKHLVIVDTKIAQNSRAFVEKVMVWSTTNQHALESFCHRSSDLCEQLMSATGLDSLIVITKELFTLLDDFGQQVGIDIVSPSHKQIHDAAIKFGGTAKPSGAGGGDMSLAVIPNDSRDHFIDYIRALGFDIIPTPLSPEGNSL